jgi:hypothetical protein
MSTTQEAVTALLAKYNDALNVSSTDAVMPLYAEDGVFSLHTVPLQLAQGRSRKPTMRFSAPLP